MVTFLPLLVTPCRVSPQTRAADEATAALNKCRSTPSHPLCIPQSLVTRTMHYLLRSFLLPFLPGPPPPGPLRLCRPCWFFKTWVADHQVMIFWEFCTLFVTSCHWLEHVRWNCAEICDWPLTQQISAKCVLVEISVLDESVHGAQCVVTAQFRQEPSIIISVNITMFANHTLPYYSIVPYMCIKISQKYLDSVG